MKTICNQAHATHNLAHIGQAGLHGVSAQLVAVSHRLPDPGNAKVEPQDKMVVWETFSRGKIASLHHNSGKNGPPTHSALLVVRAECREDSDPTLVKIAK